MKKLYLITMTLLCINSFNTLLKADYNYTFKNFSNTPMTLEIHSGPSGKGSSGKDKYDRFALKSQEKSTRSAKYTIIEIKIILEYIDLSKENPFDNHHDQSKIIQMYNFSPFADILPKAIGWGTIWGSPEKLAKYAIILKNDKNGFNTALMPIDDFKDGNNISQKDIDASMRDVESDFKPSFKK